MNGYGIAELQQAYRVMGLAHTASANDIKRAYRALLKRWHPDLYVNGTQDHYDATRMAKTINESYSRIKHAPLRYYVDRPSRPETTVPTRWPPPAGPGDASNANLPRMDRIEFSVRFVCGAVLGAFISFNLALQFYTEASLRSFILTSLISRSVALLPQLIMVIDFGARFWAAGGFGRDARLLSRSIDASS